MITAIVIFLILLCGLALPAAFMLLRWRYGAKQRKIAGAKLKVGIFHPYCNAGGGGEKVLWVALCAMQERYGFLKFTR